MCKQIIGRLASVRAGGLDQPDLGSSADPWVAWQAWSTVGAVARVPVDARQLIDQVDERLETLGCSEPWAYALASAWSLATPTPHPASPAPDVQPANDGLGDVDSDQEGRPR